MKRLKTYESFRTNETLDMFTLPSDPIKGFGDLWKSVDNHLRSELKKNGVTDEKELQREVQEAHEGHLAEYLEKQGKKFTFAMLMAIFKDAQRAKKRQDLKVGVVKALHRILPIALAPFFPIMAVVGIVFGSTRAFNKILAPILKNASGTYEGFLFDLVNTSMKVAEGEIDVEDKFTTAFVVSDKLVNALKPEVLKDFSQYLAEKMSNESPDKEVPLHYIENELKKYLNQKYSINPPLPLKK